MLEFPRVCFAMLATVRIHVAYITRLSSVKRVKPEGYTDNSSTIESHDRMQRKQLPPEP